MDEEKMKFETKVIHGRQQPEENTGAIMYPIFYTSTYKQEAPGKGQYEYSRTTNPTRERLEDSLASLEGGKYALAFTSGMAATDTVIQTLKSGDHVLCSDDLYGGTRRLFEKIYQNFGVTFDFIDMASSTAIEEALKNKKPKLMWIETPSNPLLKIIDLGKAIAAAHQYNCKVIVDNTFATPYLQNPLKYGADVVLHSTTKYLGGHSDVIGGALITNDQKLYEKFAFTLNSTGGNPSPMDSWLVLRGIKTLAVRMKVHCENAKVIVAYLKKQSWVKKIYFPGEPDHPNHQVAVSQMNGQFGGMISFTSNLSLAQSEILVQSTELFYLAESLGGVESLIEHPASMTHASVDKENRIEIGIEDGLIRLSVGIEAVEDLIEDLEQAYQKAIKS